MHYIENVDDLLNLLTSSLLRVMSLKSINELQQGLLLIEAR
jgi:hypothetical protein